MPRWAMALGIASVVVGLHLLIGQPVAPGAVAACSGGVTILLNGAVLPGNVSGCVVNLISSTGVMATATPNPSIGGTNITFQANTAYLPSIAQVQGNLVACSTTTGIPSYACPNLSVTPAKGFQMLLMIDVPCPGACTVQFGTPPQSHASIKQADGVTDPGGTGFLSASGQGGILWYDGSVLRMLE